MLKQEILQTTVLVMMLHVLVWDSTAYLWMCRLHSGVHVPRNEKLMPCWYGMRSQTWPRS